jgi:hypothetical protein
MNKQLKLEIVEVYISTSFKECVMYCADENIISKNYEKSIMLQYNSTQNDESEIVCNFFDYIGINEDEFLELSDLIITI